MLRVEELRALRLEQLVELQEAFVLVAGAIEEVSEMPLAILHFEKSLLEVVDPDEVATQTG